MTLLGSLQRVEEAAYASAAHDLALMSLFALLSLR
jgi:hypothetical protein